VISLLAIIVVPPMVLAREQAKTAVCNSKLGQLARAVTLYAQQQQNQDCLPPGDYGTGTNTWATSLIYAGCLTAPTSSVSGTFPSMDSVFRCPSGGLGLNSSMPASPEDPAGTYATEHTSTWGGTTCYVQVWYGANGHTSQNNWPFTRWSGSSSVLHQMAWMSQPGATVAFYDGYYMHSGNLNAVNARHMSLRKTNVAFFDGSGKTFQTRADITSLTNPDAYPAFAGN